IRFGTLHSVKPKEHQRSMARLRSSPILRTPPACARKSSQLASNEKTARPSATKKTKRAATKKAQEAAKAELPRKEDVPGYTPGIPDEAKWPEVARVLKVRPFYTGPGSVPFTRLRAHSVPDPTRGNQPANDFYLTSD